MDEKAAAFYETRYGAQVRAHATVREETIKVFEVDLPALRVTLGVTEQDRASRHTVRKIAKTIGKLAMAADPTITKLRVVDRDGD